MVVAENKRPAHAESCARAMCVLSGFACVSQNEFDSEERVGTVRGTSNDTAAAGRNKRKAYTEN